MRYKIIFLLLIVLLFIFRDAIIFRPIRKKIYYNLAKQRSIETNKPLLVIGDPDAGSYQTRLLGRVIGQYGCGDTCVDLFGCPSCKKSVKKDVLEFLKNQKNNSYVIFLSDVLEYVDDIENTISELYRVSNGDMFIVYVKNILWDKFSYQDKNIPLTFKRLILKAPPEHNMISYKEFT